MTIDSDVWIMTVGNAALDIPIAVTMALLGQPLLALIPLGCIPLAFVVALLITWRLS